MHENVEFTVIKEFRSVDGVVATITARLKNGRKSYTFAMKKCFDKNGEEAQTPWLQKQHIGSVRELLTQVEDYIHATEDVEREAVRAKSRSAL